MLIEGLTVFFIFILLFSVCLFDGIMEPFGKIKNKNNNIIEGLKSKAPMVPIPARPPPGQPPPGQPPPGQPLPSKKLPPGMSLPSKELTPLSGGSIDDISREIRIGKERRESSKNKYEQLKTLINNVEDTVIEIFFNTEDIKESAVQLA